MRILLRILILSTALLPAVHAANDSNRQPSEDSSRPEKYTAPSATALSRQQAYPAKSPPPPEYQILSHVIRMGETAARLRAVLEAMPGSNPAPEPLMPQTPPSLLNATYRSMVDETLARIARLETLVADLGRIIGAMPDPQPKPVTVISPALPSVTETKANDNDNLRLLLWAGAAAIALLLVWRWVRRRKDATIEGIPHSPTNAARERTSNAKLLVAPHAINSPPVQILNIDRPLEPRPASTMSPAMSPLTDARSSWRSVNIPTPAHVDTPQGDMEIPPSTAAIINNLRPLVAEKTSPLTPPVIANDEHPSAAIPDPDLPLAFEPAPLSATSPTREEAPVAKSATTSPGTDEALELAEIMIAMGLTEGAARTLVEQIRADPKRALPHWLKLLDIYRKSGMKDQFEHSAHQLQSQFNIRAAEWKAAGQAGTMESLEAYDRIISRVQALWPTPECCEFLTSLLEDNRAGTRAGFPQPAAEEILLLLSMLEHR